MSEAQGFSVREELERKANETMVAALELQAVGAITSELAQERLRTIIAVGRGLFSEELSNALDEALEALGGNLRNRFLEVWRGDDGRVLLVYSGVAPFNTTLTITKHDGKGNEKLLQKDFKDEAGSPWAAMAEARKAFNKKVLAGGYKPIGRSQV